MTTVAEPEAVKASFKPLHSEGKTIDALCVWPVRYTNHIQYEFF